MPAPSLYGRWQAFESSSPKKAVVVRDAVCSLYKKRHGAGPIDEELRALRANLDEASQGALGIRSTTDRGLTMWALAMGVTLLAAAERTT